MIEAEEESCLYGSVHGGSWLRRVVIGSPLVVATNVRYTDETFNSLAQEDATVILNPLFSNSNQ